MLAELDNPGQQKPSSFALATAFWRLGMIAFGGSAAYVAMMSGDRQNSRDLST